MATNPPVAYASLINNPSNFLRKHPVRIFGATAASGPHRYYLLNKGASFRPGTIMKNLSMKATESFEMRAEGGPMVAVGPIHNGHPFDAYSVHMDVGAGAMGFFTLGNAFNIMVTGQLSGCAFVMIPAGPGQVNVAHVKPSGQSGDLLFQNLAAANPNAQIYGATATEGQYDSKDRVASIIGVFSGGNWNIFAQKQDAMAGDYRIKSLYQIYPNKQKLS